ncbi:DUF2752 domain-containing protein [Demequina sp. SO4-18]|uniref:DUF2752 domain-containing protein n=1 Tax=Demequina sp. SO4-18 TaxID=3401026 RepID=UPI003B5AEFCA
MSTADARVDDAATLRRRRLATPLVASAVLATATLYTALADPYRSGFFPSCIFLASSGHWCPGCGGLRAVHELARGDIGAALGMNPLVVLLIIPLGIAFLLAWLQAAWRGRPVPSVPTWLAIGLPALLFVFWIVRNVPALEPYLAP